MPESSLRSESSSGGLAMESGQLAPTGFEPAVSFFCLRPGAPPPTTPLEPAFAVRCWVREGSLPDFMMVIGDTLGGGGIILPPIPPNAALVSTAATASTTELAAWYLAPSRFLAEGLFKAPGLLLRWSGETFQVLFICHRPRSVVCHLFS